ncbi:MAG: XdhC family protein [Clostridia bacterium]
MKTLIPLILRHLEANEPVVLATVLEREGSAPRGAGACMLVEQDGRTQGTVGGGSVEHLVTERALDCIRDKASAVCGYQLAPNDAADIGMVCGGKISVCCWYLTANELALFHRMNSTLSGNTSVWLARSISSTCGVLDAKLCYADESLAPHSFGAEEQRSLCRRRPAKGEGDPYLFVEPIKLAGRVYVFGGGHIAQKLVPLLNQLDFVPIVLDDREAFANSALFPDAERVILCDFTDIGREIAIGKEDFLIIMTRGHRNDHTLLVQALRTDAAYIGLIGSQSKIAHTKGLLLEEGFTNKDFARVHTPIGLPIRAETPAEIAVSIAAQMILHRAKLADTPSNPQSAV